MTKETGKGPHQPNTGNQAVNEQVESDLEDLKKLNPNITEVDTEK